MTDRWEQIESILFAALELAMPEERADYIQRTCAGDQKLQGQIEALLAAHLRAGDFLNSPATELISTNELGVHEQAGSSIGSYKLLQQIGEGGMGVVFMAEQKEPIQRTIALKIIKPGMDTRQVIARFEAERQALAMMDHRNIARVIDAGTTDSGRPYFVMELVKGIPITKYCDDQKLTLRERLELFRPVCQAVQHAHQKGIIHRDLKPTNVLIAEYDGRPVPKVIDFGVAKATAQRLTERTMFTEFGQVIGTVEYMSPEQAAFNQLDIDTRSDIYSLGVLLYEILTGSTPFERDHLRDAAFDEALRIIREEEPPNPSTRLSTSDMLPSIASNRHTEPARLSKSVRGDLDWIVMKCLERDGNRRYETASGLMGDIERYLANETVHARAPTRAYQLRKFVRRNRLVVIAGLCVAIALLVGAAVATVGVIKAQRALLRADREAAYARDQAARSEAVAAFLQDMLKSAGPSVARGRDATLLREVLERTAQRLETDLADQPEVRGDLWYTLGLTYHQIGDQPAATKLYEKALDAYRLVLKPPHPKLARTLGSLGRVRAQQSNTRLGKPTAAEGLAMARQCGDKRTLIHCLSCYGGTQGIGGWMDGNAAPYYREALTLQRELGGDPVELADRIKTLAACLPEGDQDIALAREALELYRRHLPDDHPSIAEAQWCIAVKLMYRPEKLEEAETLFRDTFERIHKCYGPNAFLYRWCLTFLTRTMIRRNRGDEAVRLVDDLIARAGQDKDARVMALSTRGGIYAQLGRLDAAAADFAQCLEIRPDDQDLLYSRVVVLMSAGREEEYRRECAHILDLAEHDNSFRAAAKASLLLPLEPANAERAARLADNLDPKLGATRTWTFLTFAMRDLRRDRYEAAIDWARQAAAAMADTEYQPVECEIQANYIQAAASARLGRMEEARAALTRGDAITVIPHTSWRDILICKHMRREAGALIPPSKPSTAAPAAPATRP